jgi:hypothetical protein
VAARNSSATIEDVVQGLQEEGVAQAAPRFLARGVEARRRRSGRKDGLVMEESENAYRMRRAGDIAPGCDEDAEDAGALVGAVEVLLRAAEIAYREPGREAVDREGTAAALPGPDADGCGGDEQCQRARLLVNGMLDAARAGGYPQADLLKTLLFLRHRTPHVLLMMQAAVSAAGGKSIREVYARLGH